MHPRTWAEVDLGAIARNLRKVKERLSDGVRILGVVKANAYGHGAVAISRILLENGVAMLGVGDSGEAIELRESGISAPLLILGAICEREIDAVIEYRIIPSIHSMERARILQEASRRYARVLNVNVMVDTGMRRVGIKPETAVELLSFIASCPNLRLVGISTHFSSAHLPDNEFTHLQLERFKSVLSAAKKEGIDGFIVHAANTAALFSIPESHFDMVRPGAALYGIDPGNLSSCGVKLEPVLSWRTQIVFLKTVEEGTPIGYGQSFVAKRRMRVATICVGYNDGFHFQLSNRADVLVNGHRCRVVGNISMDYAMVDVTDAGEVHTGDIVTIVGRSDDERITVTELGRLLGVPPYVITTSLGRRVKRVYRDTSRKPYIEPHRTDEDRQRAAS